MASQTDYYPFGMEMPGRRWRATGEDATRFGFNGKENDNEVKGEGNQQDYGFRIYDPRIARFLSVDPLSQYYPSWSPYPFAMNRVIDNVDLDGAEGKQYREYSIDKTTGEKTVIQRVVEYEVLIAVSDANDLAGVAFTSSEYEEIRKSVHHRYNINNYTDDEGLPVEYRIKLTPFNPAGVDLDKKEQELLRRTEKTSEEQLSRSLQTTGSKYWTIKTGLVHRGVHPTAKEDHDGATQGIRTWVVGTSCPLSMIVAHEIVHQLLHSRGKTSRNPLPRDDKSEEKLGGFMTPITGQESLSNEAHIELLKTVPSVPDKEVESSP